MQLHSVGRLAGYRSMTAAMRQRPHLRVSHEITNTASRSSPVGVKSRRRHRLVRRTYISLGPNHLWHTDGYDKLRLYVVGCLSTETGSVPPTVLLNMFNQAYFLRCGRVNSLTKIIHEYRY